MNDLLLTKDQRRGLCGECLDHLKARFQSLIPQATDDEEVACLEDIIRTMALVTALTHAARRGIL